MTVIRPTQNLLALFSAVNWHLFRPLRDGEISPRAVIGFREKIQNVTLIKAAFCLLSRSDGEGQKLTGLLNHTGI